MGYELAQVKGKTNNNRRNTFFNFKEATVDLYSIYDHTEVLLSDEAKVVTYVDKKRHRTTYRLDDVTIDPSQEIGKRLKYIRAIFSHSSSLPSRVVQSSPYFLPLRTCNT